VALACGVAIVAATTVLPFHAQTSRARGSAIIVPRDDRAYAYDVANRAVVARTFARIVDDRRIRDEALATLPAGHDPVSVRVGTPTDAAVVTVTVTSRDPVVAKAAARSIVARGSAYTDALSGSLTLSPLETVSVGRASPLVASHIAFAVLLATAVGAFVDRIVRGRGELRSMRRQVWGSVSPP
jgi:hypothetical protein